MPARQPALLLLAGGEDAAASHVMDDGTLWSQACTYGSFVKEGSSFTIDRATLDAVVANFAAGSPAKVPVDYEHEAADKRLAGTTAVPWTRRGGDVVELQIIDDEADLNAEQRRQVEASRARIARLGITNREVDPRGLWIRWEPMARALSLVQAGECRELSVVIAFAWENPLTGDDQGPTLHSVALTNTPFLQGMASVAASRGAGGSPTASGKESDHMADEQNGKRAGRLASALAVLSALLARPVATEDEGLEQASTEIRTLKAQVAEAAPATQFVALVGAELGETDPAKALGAVRTLKAAAAAQATSQAEALKGAVKLAVEGFLTKHAARVANAAQRVALATMLTRDLEAGQVLEAAEGKTLSATAALVASLPADPKQGQAALGDAGEAAGVPDADVAIDARAKELMETEPYKALASKQGRYAALRAAGVAAEKEILTRSGTQRTTGEAAE